MNLDSHNFLTSFVYTQYVNDSNFISYHLATMDICFIFVFHRVTCMYWLLASGSTLSPFFYCGLFCYIPLLNDVCYKGNYTCKCIHLTPAIDEDRRAIGRYIAC